MGSMVSLDFRKILFNLATNIKEIVSNNGTF